jgi:TatD DNase family protein
MTPAQLPLVDTHCHLNLVEFEEDIGLVMERVNAAGITKILVPGTDFETSQSTVTLAQQYPEVYAAVGFHPHNAKKWGRAIQSELKELAQQPKVVAIGEIGLDYYRNISDHESQQNAFKGQLELAIELELPIVVHNREAIDDVMTILNDWVTEIPDTLKDRVGVLHAFSSDENAASKAIDKGFYIGIAGPITYSKANTLRNVVKEIPLERLLIETDAPYLTPDPHRGKRNEPGHVQLVATAIAKIRQVDIDKVKEKTAENARVLFQWNHEASNSNVL